MTMRLLLSWFGLTAFSLPVFAQALPAGTLLEARLLTATGSRVSHPGDQVEATIIAPVISDGHIVIPQGSGISGSVQSVTRLGFGLRHLTASIRYRFETVELPDGETIPIETQVATVETAKERVNADGVVKGIHPLASFSSSLAFYTVPLVCTAPALGLPLWGLKALIVPSADPEIYFPAGTELLLRLTEPLQVISHGPENLGTAPLSLDETRAMYRVLTNTPEQRAKLGKHSADLVNVLVVGSRQQIESSFQAAGWSKTERKSPLSLYRMYYALTKRIGYKRAPMNRLTLNGRPADLTYQKSLDTVERRHHVRLWKQSSGADVWLGTAAEDVAFRFRLMHWTHSIDPEIDRERAKVVTDLAFTSCVDAAGLLSRESLDMRREWTARPRLLTDRQVAAVRMNACSSPTRMPGVTALGFNRDGHRPRFLTSFRDDFVRSNVVFTAYNTLKVIFKARGSIPQEERSSIEGKSAGFGSTKPLGPVLLKPATN